MSCPPAGPGVAFDVPMDSAFPSSEGARRPLDEVATPAQRGRRDFRRSRRESIDRGLTEDVVRCGLEGIAPVGVLEEENREDADRGRVPQILDLRRGVPADRKGLTVEVGNTEQLRFFGGKRECGLHEIDLASI